MSLTRAVLRIAAPVPKLEAFNRYLFIGPHPDDIEIGAGATAARFASEGKQICFLICIDGRYGSQNCPDLSEEALIQRRQQEALASAHRLGISDVRFLGLCDGGFYDAQALTRGIAGVISDFQPDVIFAPDPCVDSECHADHLNVGNAARKLAYFANYRDIMQHYGANSAPVQALAYYMTAKPNRYINTSGFVSAQMDAIFQEHQSQFSPHSSEGKAIRLYLNLRSVDFGIRCLARRAEGFRVLGTTQMHCLPEAGL